MNQKFVRSQAFNVYQKQVCPIFGSIATFRIDTVFYIEQPKMSTAEIRRQLIDHDGYPHNIFVRKAK